MGKQGLQIGAATVSESFADGTGTESTNSRAVSAAVLEEAKAKVLASKSHNKSNAAGHAHSEAVNKAMTTEKSEAEAELRPVNSAGSLGSAIDGTLTAKTLQKASTPNGDEARRSGGCCSFIRGRKPPEAFQQTLVLLRHSERLDYVDPMYKKSEEGQKWPHDAPLTQRGLELADEVARELVGTHLEAKFAAIACSPFKRCLQTACAVGKMLRLPLLIDQEIGEVWDKAIPESPCPFRSSEEIMAICEEYDVKVLNPLTDSKEIRIFGKARGGLTWPETLDSAHARFIVRVESYLEQSKLNKHNFIIVTHADALAAALAMFHRGGADVQRMDFCAQVTARRTIPPPSRRNTKPNQEESSVFADKWDVSFIRAGAEIMDDPGSMARYYEMMHLQHCEETQQKVVERRQKKTKTDFMFTDALKGIDLEEEEEERGGDEEGALEKSPPSKKVLS
eukprot:TRINITY_DN122913_c0_g1_i1.p1 TRINITY_DN122913_c0_g1~~TRINITY_DN122913_c0_g1_i1.p1  ORF type:complete len:451 (+),score=125.24 TRINITY_DN122913_c0_g1_i1:142-1494(+)